MPEGQHPSWVANAGLVGLGPVDRAITQRAQRTDTWWPYLALGPPHGLGRHVVTIHWPIDNVAYLYCIICTNLKGRGGGRNCRVWGPIFHWKPNKQRLKTLDLRFFYRRNFGPPLFLNTKKKFMLVFKSLKKKKIIFKTFLENIVLLPFKHLFKYFIIAFSLRTGHVCRCLYLGK